VSSRVDDLLRTGVLAPAGAAASSGGRPPARVAFNPVARVVVGIDLGATHGTVAVGDLAGGVLSAATVELEIADGPDAVLGAVLGTATSLLDGVARPWAEVAALGMGLPGPVEHASGRPVNPPIMPGWDRVDVPALVRAQLQQPELAVLVDNDVNVLALGEHATWWPEADDLLYVKVSTGIGAGIVMGGTLQRGARGSAGDLGHVRVPWTADSGRPAEDERELEDIASGPAIAAQLRERDIEARTSADVVALVRAADRTAIELVRQAGREVGAVVATVVNVLGPSVIVIGGSIGRGGEDLIAGVREVVYRHSLPLATEHLQIVPARGDSNAGALGAAILAARHALTPAAIATWFASPSP
jgi:glucokinase